MPRLAPELLVTNLAVSLRFWRDLLGFAVAYDRPEDGFAFLDRGGICFMLKEQHRSNPAWITGRLERPLGRGINFEITIEAIAPILDRLRADGWPLFVAPEERWYRVGAQERGVRQFLVQDPDGYPLRFAEVLGDRPLPA